MSSFSVTRARVVDALPFGRSQESLLLLRRRLGDLTPAQKAASVRALHKGATPRSHELAIRDIFRSMDGPQFQEFKYLLNSTGDYHDLEHLIWEDIDDPLLRYDLLEYIAQQAAEHPSGDLRVLSDIDDTMKCAIHDTRYPKGTVYPGYVELVRALDAGGAQDPGRPGDLTLVTARPSGPRGLVEMYTRDSLSELGLPSHSVLGGSFLNLHTKNSMAERKAINMERERQLFPECRMVFIGDSGQGDARVGAEMHRRDPEHIVATLLHNVTDLNDGRRARWARHGVLAFDTYAGAAVHALRLGLIPLEAAREVAAATERGLAELNLNVDQRRTLQASFDDESSTL